MTILLRRRYPDHCGCCGRPCSPRRVWCCWCAQPGHLADAPRLWERTWEAQHGEPCPGTRRPVTCSRTPPPNLIPDIIGDPFAGPDPYEGTTAMATTTDPEDPPVVPRRGADVAAPKRPPATERLSLCEGCGHSGAVHYRPADEPEPGPLGGTGWRCAPHGGSCACVEWLPAPPPARRLIARLDHGDTLTWHGQTVVGPADVWDTGSSVVLEPPTVATPEPGWVGYTGPALLVDGVPTARARITVPAGATLVLEVPGEVPHERAMELAETARDALSVRCVVVGGDLVASDQTVGLIAAAMERARPVDADAMGLRLVLALLGDGLGAAHQAHRDEAGQAGWHRGAWLPLADELVKVAALAGAAVAAIRARALTSDTGPAKL